MDVISLQPHSHACYFEPVEAVDPGTPPPSLASSARTAGHTEHFSPHASLSLNQTRNTASGLLEIWPGSCTGLLSDSETRTHRWPREYHHLPAARSQKTLLIRHGPPHSSSANILGRRNPCPKRQRRPRRLAPRSRVNNGSGFWSFPESVRRFA